ncbi:hypothetical protein C8R45DRAFT_450996 [Mycena sanguinolenta]|nr:hypothetical protein C8R45DRAFT_450996 [Mycena sanguinolenta]
MSSAISFSSAFSSSSKGSFAVMWVVGSAVQSLLVAFAVTTTKIKTSLQATSTIQSVLAPSPCIPVEGRLGHPYIAAIAYISVIGFLVASIFFAKTSNGASASPPDLPTPDPGLVNTASRSRDPAPPPHTPNAAAGAPPPPPPGNDATCDSERRPKRSFWFLRWLFAIVLWIFRLVARLFKWVLIKTVWRPIAVASSLLFYYVILPIILKEVGNAYGVTPVLASATGPYIFLAVKFAIDSSPTLRWLTLWGLAQCGCSIVNVLFWVVSFACRTVIGAVGFAWWTFRTLCQRTLRSIRFVLAIPTLLRRIRSYLHWRWSQFRSFFAGDAWLMLACLVFLLVYPTLTLIVCIRPMVPLVIDHFLYVRELVLLVCPFVRTASPVVLDILQESEPWQIAVFWAEWILVPSLFLLYGLFSEDVELIVSIMLLSMLVRWIFSWKRADRTARRKLEKRIKMLEIRS